MIDCGKWSILQY